MKAKHFKRLRKKLKSFLVQASFDLFGDFDGYNRFAIKRTVIKVMALNPLNACERAVKRGYYDEYINHGGTTKEWARWKVREEGKPDNHRYNFYF